MREGCRRSSGGSRSSRVGSAPALCRGSCTAIVRRGCPAAAGCMPGQLRPNNAPPPPTQGLGPGALGGRGEGSAGERGGGLQRRGGGWAGLARSAALEAAQRRRLHHPGLRAGRRRGGGTRACAGRGPLCLRDPGGAVLGAPRSGDQPGTGGSGWSEGDRPVRAGRLPCPPLSLSNPPPPGDPPTQRRVPQAPSRPRLSLGVGGAPPAPWPCPTLLRPWRPLPAPRAGRGSAPSPWDSGGRARASGTRLPSALGTPWGSQERGSRPSSRQPRGFCAPREPPRGLGVVVTSSRGRSRRNRVKRGAGGGACPEESPPSWSARALGTRVSARLRPSSLLLVEISPQFEITPWTLPLLHPPHEKPLGPLRLLSLQNSQYGEPTANWNLFFSHTPPNLEPPPS